MWVLLMLAGFREANHANGHNERSRYCEIKKEAKPPRRSDRPALTPNFTRKTLCSIRFHPHDTLGDRGWAQRRCCQ